MATVSEIVTRALQKIGVVSGDEDAAGTDLSDGVVALNSMVHAWKLRGVDLSHTDVAATDTFPYGDEYQEGFVYILAQTLAPDFETPPGFNAAQWFMAIQADNLVMPTTTIPTALTRMPSRYWRDTRIR